MTTDIEKLIIPRGVSSILDKDIIIEKYEILDDVLILYTNYGVYITKSEVLKKQIRYIKKLPVKTKIIKVKKYYTFE